MCGRCDAKCVRLRLCCGVLRVAFMCPYSSVVEHPLSKRKVGSSILLGGISLCWRHHVRPGFITKLTTTLFCSLPRSPTHQTPQRCATAPSTHPIKRTVCYRNNLAAHTAPRPHVPATARRAQHSLDSLVLSVMPLRVWLTCCCWFGYWLSD